MNKSLYEHYDSFMASKAKSDHLPQMNGPLRFAALENAPPFAEDVPKGWASGLQHRQAPHIGLESLGYDDAAISLLVVFQDCD